MRTRRILYPQTSEMYICELDQCPLCGEQKLNSGKRSGKMPGRSSVRSMWNNPVLTVTGLLPSPVIENPTTEGKTEQHSVDQVEQERQSIVDSLIRRVRYLLTLKGRPPFRMAGIEMYQGFREVCDCLEVFIAHISDERLIRLQHGLSEALKCFTDDYDQLSCVAA
ncbi:hypothetical protein DespoDRAFT_01415 [Desulfobacter postgatei 2ac9]|uniref:Uncharacterized protein n=2 Tax=Desulfobacter postgatei TaxID=2293 RepID=I5B1J9_9BACT|nr:hypothetical protein DespoDRAFT_01415 [Desulfobacter postgatei 2ac9]